MRASGAGRAAAAPWLRGEGGRGVRVVSGSEWEVNNVAMIFTHFTTSSDPTGRNPLSLRSPFDLPSMPIQWLSDPPRSSLQPPSINLSQRTGLAHGLKVKGQRRQRQLVVRRHAAAQVVVQPPPHPPAAQSHGRESGNVN